MMSGKTLTMTISWREFYQITFQQSFRQSRELLKKEKMFDADGSRQLRTNQKPCRMSGECKFYLLLTLKFWPPRKLFFQSQHLELTQAIYKNTRLMAGVEASLTSLNATMKELTIRNVDESCKLAKSLKDVVSCFRVLYEMFNEPTLFVE